MSPTTGAGTDRRHVLITGSTGFVGRNLVDYLRKLDTVAVTELNREAPGRASGDGFASIPWHPKDISSFIRRAAPDVVVHLAEPIPQGSWSTGTVDAVQSFLLPVSAILDGLRDNQNPSRLVYLDSGATYGTCERPYRENGVPQPVSFYGRLKRFVGDLIVSWADAFETGSYVLLRSGVIYGPGQDNGMLVPSLIRSLLGHHRFAMSSGFQTRDFVYIDDVAEAIVRAIETPAAADETVNIATGTSVSVREVARNVAEMLHGSETLLAFGDRVIGAGEENDQSFCVEKAVECLSWRSSTSLQDGLRATIEWHKKRLQEYS